MFTVSKVVTCISYYVFTYTLIITVIHTIIEVNIIGVYIVQSCIVIGLYHESAILYEIEALYTHAQTSFTLSTVINRAERALATEIIRHQYMLMCNHKIHINIM